LTILLKKIKAVSPFFDYFMAALVIRVGFEACSFVRFKHFRNKIFRIIIM
jgi:hypothetical protein